MLRMRAEEVDDPTTSEIRAIIADMIETLDDSGGVGLAAPQIYEPLRLIVFSVPGERTSLEGDPAGEEGIPLTILANPVIEPLSGELNEDWEGCLSIPHLRGIVPRFTSIRYSGLDQHGDVIERDAIGFHARVLQHECDHLDGMNYIQRMPDVTKLTFETELKHLADLHVGPLVIEGDELSRTG